VKLLWHLTKRDLRHFWIPVAFLAVIQGLEFWVGSHMIRDDGSDVEAYGKLAVDAGILWAIRLMVTYVLAAVVIHEDPIVGPAGWRTRPISRLKLMGAKLLSLLLLLGIVPVLVCLPWWIAIGFDAADAAHAALATLGLQMAVVLLAVPVAALTNGIGRFLLCTLVGGVVAFTSVLLLAESAGSLDSVSYWATESRILMMLVVGAVGWLAILVHQFLTTRWCRSVVMVLVVMAALEAVLFGWHWEAPAVWAFMPKEAAAGGSQVKAAVDRVVVGDPDKANALRPLYVSISLRDVPRDLFVQSIFAQQSLTWADGSKVEVSYPYSSSSGQAQNLGTIARSLSVKPSADTLWDWNERWARRSLVPRGWLGGAEMSPPIWLSPQNDRRILAKPADYKATVWLGLFRSAVVGERLAQVGSRFDHASAHGRISAVETHSDDQLLRVTIREVRPASYWTNFFHGVGDTSSSSLHYFLVNADRTNVLQADDESRGLPVIIGAAEIQMRKLFFPPNFRLREHEIKAEREAPMELDGATVAAVIEPEVERFTRRIESLPLPVPQAKYGARIRAALVTVRGAVGKPLEKVRLYPTLRSALRAAGGLSDDADPSHVAIIRSDPSGKTTRIVVDVEAYLQSGDATAVDQPLESGDIVEVPRQE